MLAGLPIAGQGRALLVVHGLQVGQQRLLPDKGQHAVAGMTRFAQWGRLFLQAVFDGPQGAGQLRLLGRFDRAALGLGHILTGLGPGPLELPKPKNAVI